MEKRALALSFLAFAAACALTLSACGGGGVSGGTGEVTKVTITPTTASVSLNGTAEFSASVTLTSSSTSSTSTAVTWEVNGMAGGDISTVGSIVASTTDVQVGIYTAPAVAPGTNNNEVNITAVAPQFPGSTTNTATVTSNTAVLTIGAGQGLAITELTTTVAAGGTHQFVATLNGVDDPNATWSVTPVVGVNVGTINPLSGLYTAPDFPPPGGSVTISAQDPTVTMPVTATVQIVYSDLSLNGPFAFSYTGNDSSGFLAAAGSFVADGQGNILSGVEDVESFATGVSTELPITGGTYVVGSDGRTTATINTGHGAATWQFVLTTNLHALMIRFNADATGSGTIDQQNLNDLTTSTSVLSGPYVFDAAGTDAAFKPMALAGRFSANGSGQIPQTGTIIDVNDNGAVTTADTTLNGSYTFDTAFPGSGRGTITLTSTSAKTLEYAFYVIDSTHIHLVEIDSNAFLAGDAFSGASGGFSNASLGAGDYVFTSGGTSATVSANAYAAGGIFTSDGGGHVTGGALDTNNGGTVTTNATISSCGYSVDGTTGRIALMLSATACLANANFAAYQTAQGSAVIVELDSTAVSTGLVFPQNLPASTALTGGFAFLLAGQGMFHNSSGSYQPEAEGEITVAGTTVTGNLDIDNFNAAFKNDPLNTTTSMIMAPGTNGRGTAMLEGTNPDVTYSLVYYLIDANTALVFDQDTSRVVIGSIERQF
jgi:hypothetical protein